MREGSTKVRSAITLLRSAHGWAGDVACVLPLPGLWFRIYPGSAPGDCLSKGGGRACENPACGAEAFPAVERPDVPATGSGLRRGRGIEESRSLPPRLFPSAYLYTGLDLDA